MSDPVNHPSHYALRDPETIDMIEDRLTPQEFRGYLVGNLYRYLDRYPLKGTPTTDLKKARWYLDLLINRMEEGKL